MSSLVSKFKNFWLGSEESYDDGFDQLFGLSNGGEPFFPTDNQEKKVPKSNPPLSAVNNESTINSATANLKVLNGSSYSATNEVIVLEPHSFNQAVEIIQYLKKGASVVLNLSRLEPESSQRLLDFVCGGIYALDGSQKRVGDGVFLLVPSSVNINSMAPRENRFNHLWGVSGCDREKENSIL